MTPLLSICTGTYNRLPYLQRFMASVRDTVPASLDYEFVICDGGSTDGTLDWLRQQDDVDGIIYHNELRGALKAFGDAARAATSDYVLLANDDILVHPGAILRALAHLEATPTCGAVAFQDNRLSREYKTQVMRVQRDGDIYSATYAQVGLFRRWLGEEAGWWGDQHPIMGKGATYGGDNFLSARILELGYTVDEVEGCRIDDLVPRDALREHNHEVEKRNPGVYYKVYPNGPTIPDAPQLPNPQTERLRVLYAPIYEPGYPAQKQGKRGLREALERQGLVVEWDYVNEPDKRLSDLVAAWQPHLVLLQLHGNDRVHERDLAAARQACPEAVVVNWNGDVYPDRLISPEMLSLLRHIDLQLVVNASVIPTYAAKGIRAAYWQVAWEPVDEDRLPAVASHDVVFLGNAYSDARKRIGETLQATEGLNVGLYGFGWRFPSGNTTYNFTAGAALYRNAKIAIGDNQFPGHRGFVSNRLFEALAHGAFLLHQRVEGLDELTGLVDGEHYIAWDDLADLQAKVRYWLQPRQAKRRREIAEMGKAFVRERHSFDERVRQLLDYLLPMVEGEHETATAV